MEGKNSPLISIITCTKNSERYLSENISSVCEQTFEDYEHLFIDGNSTDKTIPLIKAYMRNDKRVRLVVSPAKGISNAMNEGIKNAVGTYVIHLHSDDLFSNKNVLKKVASEIKKHNYPQFLFGKIIEIDSNQTKKGAFPSDFLASLPKPVINFINIIPHQAVFITKETFNKFGFFDENLKYCMDYAYWLKTYKKLHSKFLPFPISLYRVHNEANSSDPKALKIVHQEYKKVQYIHSPRFLWPVISLVDELIWKYAELKNRNHN